MVRPGPGDQVVVDGTVLEADGLEVDEALLTGAADPVLKRPGDDVMSGSSVVSGSGALAVKRISRDTRAARPAEKAARFTPVESELRDGVTTLVRYATYAMIPAGIALFMHQLTIGGGDVPEAARRMVAGVVPVVPDGLVLLASAAFAGSVVRLGKRKCLVREPAAVEGLTRVDTVPPAPGVRGPTSCGGCSGSPSCAGRDSHGHHGVVRRRPRGPWRGPRGAEIRHDVHGLPRRAVSAAHRRAPLHLQARTARARDGAVLSGGHPGTAPPVLLRHGVDRHHRAVCRGRYRRRGRCAARRRLARRAPQDGHAILSPVLITRGPRASACGVLGQEFAFGQAPVRRWAQVFGRPV
ncbi:hypothetical protein [Streptomyces sp.]|uniref:P-type ATPase n=1 Tax=Streptomyces sp. TaxID=1931 RepID=UPI002810CD8C|nr:hypothetical protein [Streptomyces sp.]